ncbi:MAG: phosphoadenosine phosphosulfate reductase [Paracoccaceae bacterium]
MDDVNFSNLIDPAIGISEPEWLDRIEDFAEDHGNFEPLGPDHSAVFIDRGPTLIVSFETIPSIRARAHSDIPLGWGLINGTDWSQLCLLSNNETWFRHRAVYEYFDRLVDEGFFENFDQVIFYGAESCGYAAAAYSVVAPGATVIAVSPQATLDPAVTGWDDRFQNMRRTSFTDRYGYAPDMLDAAKQAFILYDPGSEEDAMHASLFTRSNVTKIRCRHLDGQIETFLHRMGLLKPLLSIAATGNLTPADFYTVLRERRNYLPYLRMFLAEVERSNRPLLAAYMCRSVLERINIPRFSRQLSIATKELHSTGIPLPPAKTAIPA